MGTLLPSTSLVKDIKALEKNYMHDRMVAIQNRAGNPEGIEIRRFGNALCLYSKTMPWGAFNTVKGITSNDIEYLPQIIEFYRERNRNLQFEIVPSHIDDNFLNTLSKLDFYQSGFHTSTIIEPQTFENDPPAHIHILELDREQFEMYATIHCRGTGLPDSGIAPVAENNKVLYDRPGWKFFIAYVRHEPAAVAVMHIKDGIASLTFAATLPEFRGIGLHQFLIRRRIEVAAQNNCRLVVGQCIFLSQSHRNMERAGMKIGYVKTIWTYRGKN